MVCSNRVVSGEMTCKRSPSLIERRSCDGVRWVTLPRPTHQEIYLSAFPAPGDSPGDLFLNAAAVLRDQAARVVSLQVFGLSAATGMPALRAAFGEPAFPVTWIDEGCDGPAPLAGLEAWAVTELNVTPLEANGRVVGALFEDGCMRACRLGGLLASDLALSPPQQARAVFDAMAEILARAGMDFSNVVRTWFYNHRMLDWYGPFNKVRTTFFKEHGVFGGLVPASTGVGGRNAEGGALTAGLLAIVPCCDAVSARAVPSPLQCPALDYGSSFSRAVEVALSDYRHLLISGTASIAPEGQTVHVGDTAAQIALTMDVVRAILESREMTWGDVSRAIGYFKHPADAAALDRYLAARGLPPFPLLRVQEDICRDDLLFEIELDALKMC